MSEKLKPCPLCGGRPDGYTIKGGHKMVSCRDGASPTEQSRCAMAYNRLAVDVWQSLPRRSEAVAEVVREMRELSMIIRETMQAYPAHLRDNLRLWASGIDESASRIEAIAEQGGECERCKALETMIAQGGVTPGEKPRCARCTGVLVPTRPHPAIEHGWVMACPTCGIEDEPDLHPVHSAPETKEPGEPESPTGRESVCLVKNADTNIVSHVAASCADARWLCDRDERIEKWVVERRDGAPEPEGETYGDSWCERCGRSITGDGAYQVCIECSHSDPDCAECDKPEQWEKLHKKLAHVGALLDAESAVCNRVTAERDEAQKAWTALSDDFGSLSQRMTEVEAERDAARADVERLRKELDARRDSRKAIDCAEQERDEARTEVEGLRERLGVLLRCRYEWISRDEKHKAERDSARAELAELKSQLAGKTNFCQGCEDAAREVERLWGVVIRNSGAFTEEEFRALLDGKGHA